MFPETRLRRNRYDRRVRDLTSESRILSDRLVMPVFIDESLKGTKAIGSMHGIYRYGMDSIAGYARHLDDLGVKAILLFGIPENKDEEGSSSYDEMGVIQRSIRIMKENYSGLIITDLCMCEYTSHGHCGIIRDGVIDNDSTLDAYGKIAVTYAKSGADMIAPSGMMDGQVKAIRNALDSKGFHEIPIMSYSAKYASLLYGPFREAADSKPTFGDRRTHQMDPRNSREAMREIDLDIKEGADIVMVKPALFYLDVLSRARQLFNLPIAAYGVSGEYSMIVNAVENGLLQKEVMDEYIEAVFRAGADIFITYFAESYISNNKR